MMISRTTAKPAGYLSIVTSGLASAVNLGSLALTDATIGDRVELSVSGDMMLAPRSSGGVSIGRVAAPPDREKGTIALFLQIP